MILFRSPVPRAFLFVLIIVSLRFWGDIFSNQPWGEEGTDFFVDAVWGDVSPFSPAVATFFFVERIITSFAVLISVAKAPIIVHSVCALLFVGACSYLASPRFRWFIPSDNLRLLLCVLIAVGPGSPEVVANLPCLPYVICWGMALSLCEESKYVGYDLSCCREEKVIRGEHKVALQPGVSGNAISGFQCFVHPLLKMISAVINCFRWVLKNKIFAFFWLVGSASSHISSILIPLSILRLWYTKDVKYLWSLVCGLTCLFSHVLLAFFTTIEVSTPVFNPLSLTITVLIGNVFSTTILGVITGLPSIFLWELSCPLVYIGCTLISSVVTWCIFKSSDKRSSTLSLGLLLSIVFLFCLHSIARGSYLKYETGSPSYNLALRHFWLPYSTSLLVLIGHCIYRCKLINVRFGLIGIVSSALSSFVWGWGLSKQQTMGDWEVFYNQAIRGNPAKGIETLSISPDPLLVERKEEVKSHN